eukprot:GILJ01011296.1.p1 GENE.GILJ01011296.1~~GILJ01011296.1.p1  ORF type:complete len:346 (-),score=40.95 GILJ01011296.1:159-1196(-)
MSSKLLHLLVVLCLGMAVAGRAEERESSHVQRSLTHVRPLGTGPSGMDKRQKPRKKRSSQTKTKSQKSDGLRLYKTAKPTREVKVFLDKLIGKLRKEVTVRKSFDDEKKPRGHYEAVRKHLASGKGTVLVKQFLYEAKHDTLSGNSEHIMRLVNPDRPVKQSERIASIEYLMVTLQKFLSESGIDYWLDSGSLLGAYRDHKYIAWDGDGDVGVTEEGVKQIIAKGPKYDFPEDTIMFMRSPEAESDTIPLKFAHITTGAYIDIFQFFKVTENGVTRWVTPWTIGCHKCTPEGLFINADVIFPLSDCRLGKVTYKCPANSEQYLLSWYEDLGVPLDKLSYEMPDLL